MRCARDPGRSSARLNVYSATKLPAARPPHVFLTQHVCSIETCLSRKGRTRGTAKQHAQRNRATILSGARIRFVSAADWPSEAIAKRDRAWQHHASNAHHDTHLCARKLQHVCCVMCVCKKLRLWGVLGPTFESRNCDAHREKAGHAKQPNRTLNAIVVTPPCPPLSRYRCMSRCGIAQGRTVEARACVAFLCCARPASYRASARASSKAPLSVRPLAVATRCALSAFTVAASSNKRGILSIAQ